MPTLAFSELIDSTKNEKDLLNKIKRVALPKWAKDDQIIRSQFHVNQKNKK